MTIKAEVLRLLEENRGQFLSGNRIAGELYVSRNAVWKAVHSLQKDGHQIQAVTNKGYCLSEEDAVLSRESIEKYLAGEAKDLNVQVYQEVTSTNTVLKQMAEEGAPEGLVVAADRQTMGKGRSGRQFYAPSDTGVYFSLLLRPKVTAEEALLITTAAAVATAEGIEKATGIETGIKWVNDVYCRGKKICGILTEASVDFENGGLSYAVLGIGVNVTDPQGGFPEEIRNVAGSLYGTKPCGGSIRSRLAGEILSAFMGYYRHLTEKTFMKAYRERSVVIGKIVEAYGWAEESCPVKVLDIDEDGALIAETPDGKKMRLTSGEIRIRPIRGETFAK